jgi:hypothetical protein
MLFLFNICHPFLTYKKGIYFIYNLCIFIYKRYLYAWRFTTFKQKGSSFAKNIALHLKSISTESHKGAISE